MQTVQPKSCSCSVDCDLFLRVFRSRKTTATVGYSSLRWDYASLSRLPGRKGNKIDIECFPCLGFLHKFDLLALTGGRITQRKTSPLSVFLFASTAAASPWSSRCCSARTTCLAFARESTRSCATVVSTTERPIIGRLRSLTCSPGYTWWSVRVCQMAFFTDGQLHKLTQPGHLFSREP